MIEKLITSIPNMSENDRAEVRNKAQKWLTLGTSAQKADAEKVLAALGQHQKAAANELSEYVRSLSKAQRIVEAFKAEPLTKTDALVVQVLLDNPGLSSEKLSEKAGWKAQTWHLHFGKMCESRKERLWPAPKHETDNSTFYTGILADFDGTTHGWTMKPEAIEAFYTFGLRPRVRHEPT